MQRATLYATHVYGDAYTDTIAMVHVDGGHDMPLSEAEILDQAATALLQGESGRRPIR